MDGAHPVDILFVGLGETRSFLWGCLNQNPAVTLGFECFQSDLYAFSFWLVHGSYNEKSYAAGAKFCEMPAFR